MNDLFEKIKIFCSGIWTSTCTFLRGFFARVKKADGETARKAPEAENGTSRRIPDMHARLHRFSTRAKKADGGTARKAPEAENGTSRRIPDMYARLRRFFAREKKADGETVRKAPEAENGTSRRIPSMYAHYLHSRNHAMADAEIPKSPKPRFFPAILYGLLGIAAAASLLFCTVTLAQPDGQIDVTLVVDGMTRKMRIWEDTVGELLIACGVTLSVHDEVSKELTYRLSDGDTVSVKRAFPVAVISGGEAELLYMTEGTVGDALSQAGVQYDMDDEISHLVFEDVAPGMQIEHTEVKISYTTSNKTLYYQEEVIKDSSLYREVQKVEVEGENGVKQVTQRVTTKNGMVVSREVVDQTVVKEAVNEVIRVGTKIHYQTSYVGETRLYKEAPTAGKNGWVEMTVYRATAYCTGTKTATGTTPKLGTIAVNPDIIPYGTQIYVKGYGYGVAEDTGAFRNYGSPKDNAIDLWFNTEKEATRWGAKYNVTILVKMG